MSAKIKLNPNTLISFAVAKRILVVEYRHIDTEDFKILSTAESSHINFWTTD